MTNIYRYPFDIDVLERFRGRDIEVQADRLRLHGVLVAYSKNSRVGHVPSVLILEDGDGCRILLRSWTLIALRSETSQ